MLRKLGIGLTALALMVPALAAALGVGEYELHSHLNQPLRMTVELKDTDELSEGQLLASIASERDYERAGVRREGIHTALDFEVEFHGDGTGVLHITSDRAIREPFLNFLVELLWPTGRMMREYTVLLDPPTFEEQDRVTVAEPDPEPEQEPEPQPEPEPAPEPEPDVTPIEPSVTPEPEVAERPARAPDEPRREHRVRSGETMWQVALDYRPSRNISVQQMMMAIREMNPDAFIDDNVNLVREGAVLRMPSEQEVRRIRTRRALADMADHNRRWRERLEARGISVPDRPQVADRPVDEPEVADAPEDEGRVRLVAPDAAEDPDAPRAVGDAVDEEELEELRGRLAAREEDLDRLERENRELSERLDDLEEQLETGQSLLELRDTQIARLQEELRRLRDEQDMEITDEGLLEPLEEERIAAVEDPEAEVPEEAPEEDPAAVDEPDEEPAAPAVAGEAPDAPAPPPEPAPVAQDTVVDQLMRNLPLLAGGLGALVVLAGALVMYRRRQAEAEEEQAVAELSGLEVEGDDDFFGGGLMGAEEEQGDAFSDAPPATESGSDEGRDPLEEVDVYVAYGRHQQAVDYLRDQIGKDPERQELKTRLLEVLAEQGDSEAFEQEAQKLAGSGPAVDKRIGELRDQLGGDGGAGGEEEVSLDDLEMDLTSGLDQPSSGQSGGDEASAETGGESAAEEPEDFSFDFSLDEEDSTSGDAVEPAASGGDDEEALEDLGDFELDMGDDESTTSAEEATAGGELELSLDDDDDSGLSLDDSSEGETAGGEFELSLDDDDDSGLSLEDSGGEETGGGEFELSLDDDEDSGLSLEESEEQAPAASTSDEDVTRTAAPALDLEDTGEVGAPESGESRDFGELSLDEGMSDEFAGSAETASGQDEPDLSLDDLELDSGTQQQASGGGVGESELSLDDLESEVDELSSGMDAQGTAESAAEPKSEPEPEPASEPEPEPEPEPAPHSEPQAGADTADSAFSEDDDFDFLGDTDENATKLDLARAYIDMGDEDGARDILNEVVAEGNDDQQAEAKNLLGQVG